MGPLKCDESIPPTIHTSPKYAQKMTRFETPAFPHFLLQIGSFTRNFNPRHTEKKNGFHKNQNHWQCFNDPTANITQSLFIMLIGDIFGSLNVSFLKT